MFVQRHDRRERLGAVGAADLLSAVGVHSLVSAEIGELGVRLAAGVAAKWLDATVDVLVLLESARRREVLSTLRAGVRPTLQLTPLNDRRQFPLRGERRGRV